MHLRGNTIAVINMHLRGSTIAVINTFVRGSAIAATKNTCKRKYHRNRKINLKEVSFYLQI